MLKIGIVLNYMNFEQTIECVESLLNSGMDRVIVVDNASTNGSFETIREKFKEKRNVDAISVSENQGYACGNNVGLRYAEKYMSPDNIIFIVNPDSRICADSLNKISDVILKNPDIGAVTGLVNGSNKSVWHHMTAFSSFIYNSWVLKWVLLKFQHREGGYYPNVSDDIQEVDVVSGALFGISQAHFKKINYFDEGIFLYYEEEALYCRLANTNLQNVLLNNASYKHLGRGSTSMSKLSFKKINDESRMYVLRTYYHVSRKYILTTLLIDRLDNWFLKVLKR